MKKWIWAILFLFIIIISLFVIYKHQKNKLINIEEKNAISNVDVSTNVSFNTESNTNINTNTSESNNVSANTNNDEKDTNNKENKTKIDDENKSSKEDEETKNTIQTKKEVSQEQKSSKSSENGKKTIVIDPGHQTKGDSSKEPIGPGATETKAKVTTGATGVYTKQKESELVLKVSLLLEKALKNEGYNVIMTRITNNVNISNKERAMIANDIEADAFLRIHADSYSDSSVNRNINIMPNNKK